MLNKSRLYWVLQIGGWTLYAVVQIVVAISSSEAISAKRIIFLAYESFFCFLLTHGLRTYMNNKRWLSLSMPRLLPRVLSAVFLMSVTLYFLRIPLSISLGLFNKNVFDIGNILGLSWVYSFFFFTWSIVYFTYNYFERYNKSLKLEASIKEIELSNLKSQLNPHFIFNALNSIRALVDENPDKAKMAINQLANILRNTLVTEKKRLTRFGDELKVVRDYLSLESIRFEERLRTDFDIDPASKDFMVPPLMVQTLVENGVKHGISKLTEGGWIQLKTKVAHGKLSIRIRNSGQYHAVNGHKRRGGLGLVNTSQRLKLLYGEDAYFAISNERDNFVLTEIIIPPIHTT
ncbi:MAG TPA: histidine kinase [Cyclobacteriaceae bacterium]|nr:histidine kinase [Cytophagales bacterium]HNT49834.1 histidine kinase [Cyclobacteriaceae bacterium]HRE68004.1 histidine kinase [Cyclobacteriaceae bacterium]HRF32502.1 histidine kinase [Cyclobacteriaceae bacterium]